MTPLTSCVTSKLVSLSLWPKGVGDLPSRRPELPCTLAPISHTQGRVCGAGAEAVAISQEWGGHRYWAGWGPRGCPGRSALEGEGCRGEVRRRTFTRAFKSAEAWQRSGLAVAGNIFKTVLVSFSH